MKHHLTLQNIHNWLHHDINDLCGECHEEFHCVSEHNSSLSNRMFERVSNTRHCALVMRQLGQSCEQCRAGSPLHQVWSCPLTLLNWWWWRQEWKQTSLAHEWWSRLRSVRITGGQHDHHRHQHHLSLWHQSSTYLTSNNPSPRDFSKLKFFVLQQESTLMGADVYSWFRSFEN